MKCRGIRGRRWGIGGSVSRDHSKIISYFMCVNWLSCLENVETCGVYPCRLVISNVTLGLWQKWVWRSLHSWWFFFFCNNFFTGVLFTWFHFILKAWRTCFNSYFAPSIGLFPLRWCVHKTVSRGNAFCFTCISLGIDLFSHIGGCKYIMKCASKTLGCIPEEWCLWRCSHSLPASE